jgi:hypothetical protein
MLLPQGVDNLLVAGRCASMTHLGQSAARVSGACFVMGQAAAVQRRWPVKPIWHRALDGPAAGALQADGAWFAATAPPIRRRSTMACLTRMRWRTGGHA